ncbi:MAG: FAD-binding oxidoreductase [Spirochaetia bacterium]
MNKISQLHSIFADRVIDGDDTAKAKYGRDQVGHSKYWQTPQAVVFPENSGEVAALMRWANETGTPVTPRGAGSGLTGGAIPAADGVVCSFERMNRILEIDTDNLMVVVEPGVVTNELDASLAEHGLFFAGYPMSEDICHIGGNVAENAGGGRAVKYGTTSTYVLGAEVVTPAGELMHLGGKRLKDVTGYNLLQLIVGSEGTLGLLVKLYIRVIPRPKARGVVFASFPDAPAAARTVAELKARAGSALSAIEFVDGVTTRATNESMPQKQRTELPAGADAYLLIELDASDNAELAAPLSTAAQIVAEESGNVFVSGSNAQAQENAWRLRKNIAWWVKRSAKEFHSLEDVVVPPAAVSELVELVQRLRERYEIPIAMFGHAGDGNFHVTPMKSESMTPEDWEETEHSLLEELYRHVRTLGGTISGEHGIGRKRGKYLHLVLDEPTITTMRALKTALDPNNVLNPGVIFEP